MSIYKRASSTDRRISRIKERIAYVFGMKKTRLELCHTSGVSKDTVYDDMIFVKYLFCQTDGRQYLHWFLSHDDGVSLNVVDSVAVEVLHLLGSNYQVIAATHTNTQNLHTHFLINPVDITTGRKFSESTKDMLKFRGKINAILRKYGLEECGRVESVSEEKLDMEDRETAKRNIAEICTDENPYTFLEYQFYQNRVFSGKGVVENGNMLTPGVFYEMEQKREPETKIVQYEDGHMYSGKGAWENGKLLFPGVLYEEVE